MAVIIEPPSKDPDGKLHHLNFSENVEFNFVGLVFPLKAGPVLR